MTEKSGGGGWGLFVRILIGILFAGALIVGARSGMVLAKRQLPPGPESRMYAEGAIVTVEVVAGGELINSASPKRLRDYFFVVDAGMLEDAKVYEGITRMRGRVKLEVLDEDIDLVEVRVRSGSEEGVVMWVHVRQLPDPGKRGDEARAEGLED